MAPKAVDTVDLIPGAINDGGIIGRSGRGGTVDKRRALGQSDHGFQRGDAFIGRVVDVAGDRCALVVYVIGQRTAGTKEESGLIPAGVDFHVELFAGRFALFDHTLQGGRISDHAGIVVHEISVVAGHGIGVHYVAQG